jgi:hypothetical protein
VPKLKKISIIILSLLAGLLLLLWAAGMYFEKEAKSIVLKQVNENLLVEVGIEEVSLTLIKQFPQAALELHNLYIPSTGTRGNDTLVFAKQVFLKFSVLGLFTKQFAVDKITVKKGSVNVYIDKAGNNNYTFWKESEGESNSNFALKEVKLKNINLNYFDAKKTKSILAKNLTANCKGEFSADILDLNLEISSKNFHYKSKNETVLSVPNLALETKLTKNTEKNILFFEKSTCSIGGLQTNLEGSFKPNTQELVINFSSRKIDLANLKSIGIKAVTEFIDDYKVNGDITLNGKFLSNSARTNLTLDYELFAISLELDSVPLSLKSGKAQGTWSSTFTGNDDLISFENASAVLAFSDIAFSGSLKNFNRPVLNLKYSGELEADKLAKILKEKSNGFSGLIEFDLASELLLSEDNFQESVQRGTHSGNLVFKNTKADAVTANGKLNISSSEINSDKLVVKYAETNYTVKGKVREWRNFSDENRNLYFSASVRANAINLNSFTSSESSGNSVSFPKNWRGEIQVKAAKLEAEMVTLHNLSTELVFTHSGIELNNIEAAVSEGSLKGNASLLIGSQSSILKANLTAQQTNVRELFKLFDSSFDLPIKSEMIRGRLSTDVQLGMSFDKDLSYIDKTLLLHAQTHLINGELIDVPLLADITDYMRKSIKVNAFLNIKQLQKRFQHIRFKNLYNSIEVKKGVLTIPNMKIESDAFTLEAGGTHIIGGDLDYNFSFFLSELFKKKEPKNSDLGYIVKDDENNGIKLFVRMYGSADDPQFDLNKPGADSRRKERLAKEKEEFKALFKKEEPKVEQKAKPRFNLDWEEKTENTQETEEKTNPEESKEKRKRKTKEKAPTEEFDFGDDEDF